jgi:hypothetical protein
LQVARGTTVSDQDGARTATLLFQPGTQASMTLADGSSQSLSTLSIRATEFTVGSNGPAAMPAKLPPTSAYTYAVELSCDEALSAGAQSVTFSQPVVQYVENFLGFPVGENVPVGYYDRALAGWAASANGRVIRMLGITNGPWHHQRRARRVGCPLSAWPEPLASAHQPFQPVRLELALFSTG